MAKGAITQELADAKFETWLNEKGQKIENKKQLLQTEKQSDIKDRMAAENKKREEIGKAVLAKSTLAAEAERATEAPAEPVAAVTEQPSETPAAQPTDAPAESPASDEAASA